MAIKGGNQMAIKGGNQVAIRWQSRAATHRREMVAALVDLSQKAVFGGSGGNSDTPQHANTDASPPRNLVSRCTNSEKRPAK